VKLSDLIVNAEAKAYAALLNGGSIEFYTGNPPASVESPATGTLLATAQLPNPAFNAPAVGVATMVNLPIYAIDTAGLAGWARLKTPSGGSAQDVTVGTSGADLIVTNDNFVPGNDLVIFSFTYTRPKV